MRVLRQALTVIHLEAAMFRRFARLWLLVPGIVLIPALHAFIYLQSVWDPGSRTAELPAIIVNQDRGAVLGGQPVNIGADLAQSLREKRLFGYRDLADPAQARQAVRLGESVFALIIPEDFSTRALAAQSAGAGRLVVVASEGNNYIAAGLAKRFASELGHELNEALGTRRWTAVLGASATSSDSLQRLREGTRRLREGAIALEGGLVLAHDGSAQAAEGVGKLAGQVGALTDGVRQLSAGMRTLEAKRPAAEDLQAFRSGAAQLAAGHAQWAAAAAPLDDGARRLREGVLALGEEAQSIPFYGAALATATTQLGQGAAQLQAGLSSADEARSRLASGAQSVAAGASRLVDGFGAYASGVSAVATRLPADAALDELATGGVQAARATTQLREGLGQVQASASQLAAGLDIVVQSLPDAVDGPTGTPEGLAMSVQPRLEIEAPVAREGLGLAPGFMTVALWLGVTMAAFVLPLRQVPLAAHGSCGTALVLGKMGVLGVINVAQALVMWLMAWWVLGLQPVHAGGLAVTLVASSLTFMLVVLMVVRAFGDIGKVIALVLLVLQLSSAGGVTPIELTNDFFRAISPWMPFTWSVKAVRASAFGAFGGEWVSATAVMLLFAVAAFALAVTVGRWRFVSDESYRPSLDF